MNDDHRISRIENKLDSISDRIGNIDVTLAAQHESLKEHIRRTSLLEEAVKPLTAQYISIKTMAKAVGTLVGVAIVLEAIISLLTYLRHL